MCTNDLIIICNAISSDLIQKLPEIKEEGIIGAVTQNAAKRFGLKEGTKVTSGGGDNMMAAIGTRAVRDGSITITHPKRMKTFSIQISFTGTKELIQGIQKFLKVEHLTLRQRFPERNNNNYTLTISGFQQCYQILSDCGDIINNLPVYTGYVK